MLFGIDHLVVAVESVEAAADELGRDLGLAFTGGGRHEAWGTYNRLAFLGDTFIELIGVFDRSLVLGGPGAVSRAALEHLESRGEGLVTYALAVDALAGEVAALRREGSPIGDAVPGSRRRPDGETVRWWTAWADLGPDRPPFLIEHEPTGGEWGAAGRAARAAFRHPMGEAIRLATLELPVRDPDAVADLYARDLGIAFSEGWRVVIGGQTIVLSTAADHPVVQLVAGPGTAPLDVVLFGVRWRRAGQGDAWSEGEPPAPRRPSPR
jgi:hypothetical protein